MLNFAPFSPAGADNGGASSRDWRYGGTLCPDARRHLSGDACLLMVLGSILDIRILKGLLVTLNDAFVLVRFSIRLALGYVPLFQLFFHSGRLPPTSRARPWCATLLCGPPISLFVNSPATLETKRLVWVWTSGEYTLPIIITPSAVILRRRT